MQTHSADDFEEIRKIYLENQKLRKIYLEHLCAIKNGLPSSKCWCYRAGEDGKDLPCPTEYTGE